MTVAGAFVLDDTTWTVYTQTNGLANSNAGIWFHDSHDHIWIAPNSAVGLPAVPNATGGIAMYDGVQWRQFTSADGYLDGPTKEIVEDAKGRIWFRSDVATEAQQRIGHQGNCCVYDGSTMTKVASEVTRLYADPQGDVWNIVSGPRTIKAGTMSNARTDLEPQPLNLDHYRGDLPDINDVQIDSKRRLWIASWGRVGCFDGKRMIIFGKKEGVKLPHFWGFWVRESPQGDIIVPGAQGLCAYDGSTWKCFRYDHVGPYTGKDMATRHAQFDASGRLWVYYNGNIGCYDGKTWTQDKQDLEERFSLADSKGRIWVADDKGIGYLKDGTWKTSERYTQVKRVVEDDRGNIWLAMENGLLFFDGTQLKLVDGTNGFPGLGRAFIYVDHKGRIWMPTSKGLCYFEYDR